MCTQMDADQSVECSRQEPIDTGQSRSSIPFTALDAQVPSHPVLLNQHVQGQRLRQTFLKIILFLLLASTTLLLYMGFLQLWRVGATLQLQCMGFSCGSQGAQQSCTGLEAARHVESSWSRDQTHVPNPLAGGFFTTEPPGKSWVSLSLQSS